MLVGEVKGWSHAEGVGSQKIIDGSSFDLFPGNKDSVFPMKSVVKSFEVISKKHEEREDNCTVGPGVDLEVVLFSEFPVVVDFSIGDDSVLVLSVEVAEGLLSLGSKIVDRQSVEANDAGCIQMNDRVIWSSWFDLFKACQLLRSQFAPIDNCPNPTHL